MVSNIKLRKALPLFGHLLNNILVSLRISETLGKLSNVRLSIFFLSYKAVMGTVPVDKPYARLHHLTVKQSGSSLYGMGSFKGNPLHDC